VSTPARGRRKRAKVEEPDSSGGDLPCTPPPPRRTTRQQALDRAGSARKSADGASPAARARAASASPPRDAPATGSSGSASDDAPLPVRSRAAAPKAMPTEARRGRRSAAEPAPAPKVAPMAAAAAARHASRADSDVFAFPSDDGENAEPNDRPGGSRGKRSGKRAHAPEAGTGTGRRGRSSSRAASQWSIPDDDE